MRWLVCNQTNLLPIVPITSVRGKSHLFGTMYHADVILHSRQVLDREKKYLADELSLDPCGIHSKIPFQIIFRAKQIYEFFWDLEYMKFINCPLILILSRSCDTLYDSIIRKYHTDMILSSLCDTQTWITPNWHDLFPISQFL